MICSSASGPGHGRSVSLSSYPSSKHSSDSSIKRKRVIEGGEGEQRDSDCGAPDCLSLSSSGQSISVSTSSALGAARVASTIVTNVVRPVVSTPVPIASKSGQDRKTTTPQAHLLIGSGVVGSGATLAPSGGGGHHSSSLQSSVTAPGRQGGLSLVLGGAFQAPSAVQLITPPPSQNPATPATVTPTQSNGPAPLPLLQPHILPTASPAPSAGQKAVTQVQYILPTFSANNPKSPSPQQPSQATSIFTLPTAPPTHASVANGKQTGYSPGPAVGMVNPGARGEETSFRENNIF